MEASGILVISSALLKDSFGNPYYDALVAVLGDEELVIPVRMYNNKLNEGDVCSYQGTILRENAGTKQVCLSISTFQVIFNEALAPDGMHLPFNLIVHGTMMESNLMQSNPYHDATLKNFGDFRTKIVVKDREKRRIPTAGAKLVISGTVVDFQGFEFVIASKFILMIVGSIDYCPSLIKTEAIATTPESSVKRKFSGMPKRNAAIDFTSSPEGKSVASSSNEKEAPPIPEVKEPASSSKSRGKRAR